GAGHASKAGRRGLRRSELRAARLDIMVGMAFSNLVMYFIILTSAAVLHAHGKTDIQTAEQAAAALEPLAGPLAFSVFPVGMVAPPLLALIVLLGADHRIMKRYASGRLSLALTTITTAFMGVAALAMVATLVTGA